VTVALRSYQREVLDRVAEAFDSGATRVLLQGATGSGKTATSTAEIEPRVLRGMRVLFLAHRDSLLEDTHARLQSAGIWSSILQAGRPVQSLAPVQVCSIQTLHARNLRPQADFVIIDEAHHVPCASMQRFVAAYPATPMLGLSATPERADGRSVGDTFDALVCGPSVRWLTERGYLVPCDVIAPSRFLERELALHPVAAYARFTPGQRAIMFAANVTHARTLTAELNAVGITADCVVGDTPRTVRQRVRERMTAGDLRVLVGVGVFVEGYDLPAAEAIILARGFGHVGAFLQAIGRGLRPSPATGKTRCTVVDLRGCVHALGLPDEDRVWSLKGVACRRAEPQLALRRCGDCFAIFRASVSACPRCGHAAEQMPTLPRIATRAERLENLAALPQHERDRRYMAALERVAEKRIHLNPAAAQRWALRAFMKRFGRSPEVAA
jgi:superfamily II DNA or RNA helicase